MLFLSPAEIQMNNWKPYVKNIIQQFQDFDTDGFDDSKVLLDVVQNSKLHLMQCNAFLFGLKYTDSPSASNWAIWSVENYVTLPLPETFEEFQKIPLNKTYNFLKSLDKTSIDKEIERLSVEALMFGNCLKLRMP